MSEIDRLWILYRGYSDGPFNNIAKIVSETAKTVAVKSSMAGRKWTIRKSNVLGRFPTEEAAEACAKERRRISIIYGERKDAIDIAMGDACLPFREQLRQLQAEKTAAMLATVPDETKP